jgi:hypothetical protein
MNHDGGLETTGTGPGPTTQWTRPTEFLLISRNGETKLKNLAIQWNSFRPGPSNWQLFFRFRHGKLAALQVDSESFLSYDFFVGAPFDDQVHS